LLRTHRAGKPSANKIHLMKFLQEMRGYDLVANRQPMPKPNGMYLTQLRSHIAETTLPPRRKLAISVTPGDASNQLRAVRIVQVAVR
jgi:hypothetical protein